MPVRDTSTAPRGGGRASLKLVNAECPGRFIARVPVDGVNALACPVLSFDYKVPPGVKLNLYFEVPRVGQRAARTYFIRFSGPEKSTEGVKCAGRFEDVRADDTWRTARIDLGRAMRRFYPRAAKLPASHFRFGFDHRRTYAVAGIGGGNPRGAVWHVDNFLLVEAGAGAPAVRWKPYTAAHGGYATAVSDEHDTRPPDRADTSTPYVALDAGRTGLSYFHVRPVTAPGEPHAATAHFPVYNVGPEVRVDRIIPAERSVWGGEPIRVQFPLFQVAALDAGRLAMQVGSHKATLKDPALTMDWERGRLTYDPARAEGTFENGSVVNCSFVVAALGSPDPPTVTWQYVASRTHDRTPPGRVHVEGQQEPDGFETGREGWHTEDHAACGADRSTASTGRASLRLFNTHDGGKFLVYRPVGHRPVGAVPVIEFDYKAPPHVRTDLVLRTGRGFAAFKFLDRSGKNRVGSIPDVVADNTWRSASVDVFKAFWNADRSKLAARLHSIGFGDLGWPSAREGDCYHIDNLRMVPVVSSRRGLELICRAHDALGVRGYAYKWSERPDDEPSRTPMAEGGTIRFHDLPEGRRTLHIRAVDHAGNWGPVAHYPFIIDSTPPKIARILPRPGKAACPDRFSLILKDRYGPDPSKLRLRVDRQTYTFSSPALSDARRPAITWDLMQTPEAIEPIPDGKVIRFTLSGIEDFAGNAVEPIEGVWKMDYRRDRHPPQRVEMDPQGVPVALVRRFDRGLEGTHGHAYAQVEHVVDREAGSHVLRYASRAASTQGAVFRHKPFDLATAGLAKLDIRLPKSTTYLDLILMVRGAPCKVRVGDRPRNEPKPGGKDHNGYVFLGAMNGIRSSDGWHAQWADLGALARKHLPKGTDLDVRQIRLGRYCRPFSRARYTEIDNLMIYGAGGPKVDLKLRSRDITGLSGYAVAVARKPTPPAQKVNHEGDRYTRTLEPGTWFIQARARDNNGHWSRLPGVLPYVVKK
jgi:hypothetical protein